jgi:hypothetical protein
VVGSSAAVDGVRRQVCAHEGDGNGPPVLVEGVLARRWLAQGEPAGQVVASANEDPAGKILVVHGGQPVRAGEFLPGRERVVA